MISPPGVGGGEIAQSVRASGSGSTHPDDVGSNPSLGKPFSPVPRSVDILRYQRPVVLIPCLFGVGTKRTLASVNV